MRLRHALPSLSSACDTDGIYCYAESGLWYDAIACLVERWNKNLRQIVCG